MSSSILLVAGHDEGKNMKYIRSMSGYKPGVTGRILEFFDCGSVYTTQWMGHTCLKGEEVLWHRC